MLKQCHVCASSGQGPKPLSEFYRNALGKHGVSSTCKPHARERAAQWQKSNHERYLARQRKWKKSNPGKVRDNYLRSRFRISAQDYERMLSAQGGVCATCRSECSTGKALAVDHNKACCPGDKSCGKCIRGLLCRDCNTALGMVKDKREILAALVRYLGGQ